MAYSILVSAQGPLVLGFLGFGAKGLGPGLDNNVLIEHGGLPDVLPLAVHLGFFVVDK